MSCGVTPFQGSPLRLVNLAVTERVDRLEIRELFLTQVLVGIVVEVDPPKVEHTTALPTQEALPVHDLEPLTR